MKQQEMSQQGNIVVNKVAVGWEFAVTRLYSQTEHSYSWGFHTSRTRGIKHVGNPTIYVFYYKRFLQLMDTASLICCMSSEQCCVSHHNTQNKQLPNTPETHTEILLQQAQLKLSPSQHLLFVLG